MRGAGALVFFALRAKVQREGVVNVEELIEQTLAGDEAAWQRLWQEVEPMLRTLVRRPQVLGRLAHDEDDCRNVIIEVMARLRANRFARLARYAEARRAKPTLPFLGWLHVVARRVAVDYVRGHEAYVDRRHDRNASSPGAWRNVGTLPPDSQLPGARPPVTDRGTAHQMFAAATAELPEDQGQALGAWLEGATFDEIAGGGAPRDAKKQVRAALGSLRRRFRRVP